jgi:hypothetical protein
LGLLKTLCPFQLFNSDGAEWLVAESARASFALGQHHLVCLMELVVPLAHYMFREVLDRSVTVPDRSETQSPTSPMCTIRSMARTSHTSALPRLARILPHSSHPWSTRQCLQRRHSKQLRTERYPLLSQPRWADGYPLVQPGPRGRPGSHRAS